MSRITTTMCLLLPALLLGCTPDEETADPPAATGDTGTADSFCADAPVTTWDNFGAGFVTQHCQACHASSAPERNGAPTDVSFDTEDDVWMWADRILTRSAGEAPDMPPQGGVDEDDRYLLEVWLTCGG
jgi:uncharacterized membrane protein